MRNFIKYCKRVGVVLVFLLCLASPVQAATAHKWEKFNISSQTEYSVNWQRPEETYINLSRVSLTETMNSTQTFTVGKVYTSCTVRDGQFVLSSPTSITITMTWGGNRFTAADDSYTSSGSVQSAYYMVGDTVYHGSVSVGVSGSSSATLNMNPRGIATTSDIVKTVVQACGSTSYGYVLSTSSSTYPSNAMKDGYWYIYTGTVESSILTWNTGESTSTTEQFGNELLSLPADPVRVGYTFVGWYTAASGGTQVTSSSTVPSSDTTYYAQWTANTYAVTWDDGQGNRSFSTQTYDMALILPTTDPTKTGYTFIGWFTAPTGGAQVTASTIYQTADASTYYAQYTANSYVITWDVEGSASTSIQFYDATLELPVSPTKTGYSFTGWVDSTGNPAPAIYQVDGPSTYYATFSPNTYTITWIVDGVVFDTTSQVYDQSVQLPLTNPSKDKHHFDGWWTADGYPVTATIIYQTASNVTYYAHWIQVFSVTVPATMPVAVGEDGAVYAPELQISNASTGSVKVSSVTLNSLNGWTIVPYDTNMAGEKVDAKLVGLSLNDIQTSTRGTSETFSTDWFIDEDDTLTLSYDAVVSAASQAYTDETVITIVFIIEWA